MCYFGLGGGDSGVPTFPRGMGVLETTTQNNVCWELGTQHGSKINYFGHEWGPCGSLWSHSRSKRCVWPPRTFLNTSWAKGPAI